MVQLPKAKRGPDRFRRRCRSPAAGFDSGAGIGTWIKPWRARTPLDGLGAIQGHWNARALTRACLSAVSIMADCLRCKHDGRANTPPTLHKHSTGRLRGRPLALRDNSEKRLGFMGFRHYSCSGRKRAKAGRLDLKSRGLNRSCGFESRLGHLVSALISSAQECSEALEKGLLNASQLSAEMQLRKRRPVVRSAYPLPRSTKV